MLSGDASQISFHAADCFRSLSKSGKPVLTMTQTSAKCHLVLSVYALLGQAAEALSQPSGESSIQQEMLVQTCTAGVPHRARQAPCSVRGEAICHRRLCQIPMSSAREQMKQETNGIPNKATQTRSRRKGQLTCQHLSKELTVFSTALNKALSPLL